VELQTGNTLAAWPAGGHLWRSRAGDLSPLFGGNLRAQFGTRQAFAGFLQVDNTLEEDRGDDEDDDDTMLKYSEGLEEGTLLVEGSETNRDTRTHHSLSSAPEKGGRIVAFGDSSFVDTSSYEQNSIYGSLKLLEVLVGYLSEGSVPSSESEGGWGSYPELLTEEFRDDRLLAAFSSFSVASRETLERERVLRRAEFLRYSSLFDDEGGELPAEEFCSAF
jgi:hypothetical protein